MRKLFVGLTVGFLAVTALLAWSDFSEVWSLRDDAHARLLGVQDTADAAFLAAVADAGAALDAWTPGAELPPGLARAEVVQSVGEVDDPIAVAGTPYSVQLRAGRIDLVTAPDADDRSRRGTFAHDLLASRIEAEAGPPADPSRDVAGRYSVVQLVDGKASRVRWELRPPEPEDEEDAAELPELPGVPLAATAKTFPLKEIGLSRTSDGDSYKDVGGQPTFGRWSRSTASERLWLVVEVRDEAAMLGAAGVPLDVFGNRLARLYWWHATLALAVICLLVSAFLSLRGRGVQYGVLLRTFSFVRPYTHGAIWVVVLGLLFMAAETGSKVLFIKILVDVLVDPGPNALATLWLLGIATCVLAVFIAGTGYLKEYLHNYYATAMMADIRYSIGRKILSLPLSYFHRIRAGDLVARIERDAANMRKVLNLAFKTGAVKPFEMVALVVTAFALNWRLALVLLGMPLIVLPLFQIAKRIKKRAEKRQVLLAEISHVIFQLLIGIKVVKAFTGEQRESVRLKDAITRFLRQARRIHRLSALSTSLLDLLQMLGAAVIMVAGGYFVLGGAVTVGDISAFIIITQRIYKAAKQLTDIANQIVNAQPGIARVYEVLDAESDLLDGPHEMESGPLTDGIRFENVSFAYDEKAVLEEVDLQIRAGEVVAVVGPTGAGKTTLCDLVARFYDPTGGAVNYDGRDIRDFTLKSLRKNVAIVTQDAFLFNASVEENILYGKPRAAREDVVAAARDAFVHDEIEAMEGGYEKIAGERGTSVSGGQRQRITIARAILKDAPVLILDEATSALDSHAEKQVQAAMDKLMRGRTVIVVAHRLSTIRNADKVVVMRDGRIVEQGAPSDLLQRPDGQFKRMYELQMGTGGGDVA